MAGKLRTHLMVHCALTRVDQSFDENDILRWHLGPRDNKDGSVTYLGKKYPNRTSLPKEEIGGYGIVNMKGNGWSKPGYKAVILNDGRLAILVEDDGDEFVDPSEITFGAAGTNNYTEHICLMGGVDVDGEPSADFTKAQLKTLNNYLLTRITKFPKLKVIGHNQVTNKKFCPSMDMRDYAKDIGLGIVNIDMNNYDNNDFLRDYKKI